MKKYIFSAYGNSGVFDLGNSNRFVED